MVADNHAECCQSTPNANAHHAGREVFCVRADRPRAKGGGVPLASRRGCSRVAPTKKRADLGSSCHVGHGSATLVVGPTERKKLRKPGLMSATEKPAQTRQEKKMDFFLVQSTRTQPEATDRHRQTPLRAHPNTPKNRLFAAGGSTTAPLARGRSAPAGRACQSVEFAGGGVLPKGARLATAQTSSASSAERRRARRSAPRWQTSRQASRLA